MCLHWGVGQAVLTGAGCHNSLPASLKTAALQTENTDQIPFLSPSTSLPRDVFPGYREGPAGGFTEPLPTLSCPARDLGQQPGTALSTFATQ